MSNKATLYRPDDVVIISAYAEPGINLGDLFKLTTKCACNPSCDGWIAESLNTKNYKQVFTIFENCFSLFTPLPNVSSAFSPNKPRLQDVSPADWPEWVPRNPVHVCTWKLYEGIMNRFEYCTICDAKRDA